MIKPRIPGTIDIDSEMKPGINGSDDGKCAGGKRRRLIIYSKDKLIYFFLWEEGRILHFDIEDSSMPHRGDIYIARVCKTAPEMGGCFVKISSGCQCYLPQDECSDVILQNRKYDGCLKCEDVLVVTVKKEAYRNKRAVCSTILDRNIYTDEKFTNLLNTRPQFSLIESGESTYDKLIRMYSDGDFTVICNDKTSYEYAAGRKSLEGLKIILYNDKVPLAVVYGLRKAFDDITQKNIHLASGASIVIEQTEAMNVIDVNSSKSSGRNREDAALSVNIEAAEEISYQISARNLSGIIIVDFISMKNVEYNTILISRLKKMLSDKKVDAHLVDITKLGLAEITRPKKKADIYELIKKMDKTILM